MDFDIIWDGRHEGANRDLLCVERHPTMPPPAPRRQRELEPKTLADCAVLYELLSWRGYTNAQIQERLKWTAQDVQHRLEALLTLGINVVVTRRVYDERNRPVRMYRVFPS